MSLLLPAGSIALASLNILAIWLIGRKRRAGWLVTVTAQSLAIPYDVLTRQYGFMVSSSIVLCTALAAWRRWGVKIDEGSRADYGAASHAAE